MCKKTLILIIIIIIIAGGLGYWVYQSKQEPEEETKDKATFFLEELKQETGINFLEIKPAEIIWHIEENQEFKEIAVQGKSFEIREASRQDYKEIEKFLGDQEFQADMYNIADGTVVGAVGYVKDGEMVCLLIAGASGYREATGEWIPPDIDKLDIEIKCGEAKVPTNSLVPIIENQTITTKVSADFSIVLDSNPTTGYEWIADFNTDYIKLISKEYNSISDEPLIGEAGYDSFNFRALKSGEIEIKFSYLRPWESKAPLEERIYNIIIE